MLKETLLKLVDQYCKINPSWQEENEVVFLKHFLETEDIELRHESNDIFFAEFKKYLADKNEKEVLHSLDTNAFIEKKCADLFKKIISTESKATDLSNLDRFPDEIVLHVTANYLDHKSIFNLSETSSAFYTITKSIDYWRDKFIAAGCNANLLNQVCHTDAITNYKLQNIISCVY